MRFVKEELNSNLKLKVKNVPKGSLWEKVEVLFYMAREIRKSAGGEASGLTDRVVHISRVAKVVKGGRRFSFSALVVCGDGQGRVGYGMGKAAEVPDAIKKGAQLAKKHMIPIFLSGDTIPHNIIGRYGAARVLLRPAGPGTGVIAGGVVRAVVESAGVRNILSKCIGTSNPHNVIKATFNGLTSLKQMPKQESEKTEDQPKAEEKSEEN